MAVKDNSTQPLFTFEFTALCLLIFVAYGNVSVYYGLYVYVAQIGVPLQWRGLIVGGSSLATIACFIVATPYLTMRIAARATYAGLVLLIASGLGYLFVRDTAGLLLLRLLCGAGVYLVSASSMTRLVSIIPPNRAGQAFGFYSVASLLPFSLVPALFDWMVPLLGSMDRGYAIMSLALVPAAAVNYMIGRRGWRPRQGDVQVQGSSFTEMFANLKKPSITMLLLVNTVYSITFSSIFFLAKALFNDRGIANVGLFYGIQTFCMIAIRVGANRIFDQVEKVRLVRVCYALTATGFALIAASDSLWVLYLAALVIGVGMGLGVPSLNGLMFGLSEPRFRAMNTNLMMMSVHVGNVCGPVLGNVAVGLMGYEGFLYMGCAANLLGILMSFGVRRGSCRAC